VRTMVGSARLVTLIGPGGCGKTRLALQTAAELTDGSGDGVWLVELAAVTDQDAVAAAVCQALRITAQPGRGAVDVLTEALAPQQALIVLDNCEHLIGDCAKVADAIMRYCPRVHLLATSREPLGISGEHIYRVPSLAVPGPEDVASGTAASFDAVALFVARARSHGISLPVDDEQVAGLVVSVCRRLDGLPLAIELAAARLRSMSLSVLHDRLDQRFRLLTGGSRITQRQQTLRAAVDWSYSLLTASEQRLLQRLSVFADGFDLAAAEGVCGFGELDELDVAELLGSLIDKSLVVADELGGALRYRLLETIRQYAAEQLAEAGGDAAVATVAAAHCVYFLAVAEEAALHLDRPEQGTWLSRLDADEANLMRAAGHAAGHAAAEPDGTGLILRFGVALYRYWAVRPRQLGAAARLLLPALEQATATADPRVFAEALRTGSWLCVQADDVPSGLRLAERALQLARSLADDRLLIDCLGRVASAHYFSGAPELGLPFAREGVERARSLGDDAYLAPALQVYLRVGGLAPDEAKRLEAEIIACTERTGDHVNNMFVHSDAAVRALLAGDLIAARAHIEEAVRVMHELGADHAILVTNQGWVLRQQKDPAARLAFETGLQMSRRSGERAALAGAVLGLACLAADLEDWQRAAVLIGAAQALRESSGRPWGFGAGKRDESLGLVRSALGDQEADRAYARGVALSFDQTVDLAMGRAGR